MEHALGSHWSTTRSKAIVYQDVLESRSFSTFDATLAAFLDRAKKVKPKIAAASFGIAGPVVDNRVKATNLPWTIDGRTLCRSTSAA